MIDRETFFKGIEKTSTKPFRVVPFFDPAHGEDSDEGGM